MGLLMLDVGGRRFDGHADGRSWIGVDGLSGWWDSAETSFGEESDYDGDGAADPTTVNVGPKRVQVALIVEASSPEWAALDVRSWAASLAKYPDLGFRVFEAGEWLALRKAKVRGQVRVRPNRRDMRLTDISFTAWSADPRKYGRALHQIVDADAVEQGGLGFPISPTRGLDFASSNQVAFPGVFRIDNPGTAEFYPIFTVRGPVDGFTIASDGHLITYSAPVNIGDTLTLSPYAGGRAVLNDTVDVSHNLTRADWVPVLGNQERGYTFTAVAPGGGSQLFINYWAKADW